MAEPSKSAVARALDMAQERERERQRALASVEEYFLEALAVAGDVAALATTWGS